MDNIPFLTILYFIFEHFTVLKQIDTLSTCRVLEHVCFCNISHIWINNFGGFLIRFSWIYKIFQVILIIKIFSNLFLCVPHKPKKHKKKLDRSQKIMMNMCFRLNCRLFPNFVQKLYLFRKHDWNLNSWYVRKCKTVNCFKNGTGFC